MGVNVGVIGTGPWGKNHIRVFHELKEANLKTVCDLDVKILEKIKSLYNVTITANYTEILRDAKIDAVSICLPASLHYKVVKEALNMGKNVLVEKPFTLNSKEAFELVGLAEKKKLVLGVGQIFRYEPTIAALKKEIAKGTFGKLYCLSQARMGLKKPRQDVGVIFNYAVHDIDIMCDILNKDYPNEITAITSYALGRVFDDHAIIVLKFDDVLAYTQVSWLIPQKIRELRLIGEKRSADLDIMNFEMEIFDSGIVPQYDSFGKFQLITKQGDSYKQKMEKEEPLKKELLDFITAIKQGGNMIADANVGFRAVRISEAAYQSAKEKRTIKLDKDGNSI